jgi:hypothetical protein
MKESTKISQLRQLIREELIKEGFFDDVISGAKSSWKRNITGTYEEPVYIWIKCYNKNKDYHCFLENKGLDNNVNIKLMDILNDKFNLNFNKERGKYYSSIYEFDYSKLEDVSEYLIGLGLERDELERKGGKDISFKGKLSMKDLQ